MSRRIKKLLQLFLGLAIVLITVYFLPWRGAVPDGLGIRDGKFKECPRSPNCVSSQEASSDQEHYIRPFTYSGPRDDAKEKLLKLLPRIGSTEVLKDTNYYLHIEFSTFWIRFRDDIEFFFPNEKREVWIRSASRLGNRDYGANRDRLEKLRTLFEAP